MTYRSLAPIFVLLTAGAVSACSGGGGGGGSNPPPTPVPTATPKTCSSFSRGPAGTRLAPRALASGVVPDQLYVRYRTSAGTRGMQAIEKSASVLRGVDLGTAGAHRLRAITLAPGSDANAVAATLKQNPDVVDVSPVHYRSLASDPSAGANDTLFDNDDQWYMYKTNVVHTPNTTNPSPLNAGAWNFVSTGLSSIKVAVIDTGVDVSGTDQSDFNIDFAESIINGVVNTSAGAVQDTDGHGTNTSGLATALANNGYGFAGDGFSVHLLAYKVFPDDTIANPCPSANTADEAAAINDAVNIRGATVISLSLGSPQSQGPDAGEQAAVANAIAHNVPVVAAAGNEFPGTDGQQVDYPAAYPGVIAVGASAVHNTTLNVYASITDEYVATYSNSGATLVAPGGDSSADPASNCTPGQPCDFLHWVEGYSTTKSPIAANQCSNSGGVCRVLFNGTSQATPQVAGTVALMEAYHGGSRSLTAAQITGFLTSTADSIGQPATRQGAGRLNAGKAVAAAHP